MASEQKERAVRPITVVKFAGAVIATLIGSGFASGQEAMQFFAAYGTNGIIRCIIAILLFAGITGRRFWPQSNLSLRVRRDGQTLQDDFSHEQCLVVSQDGHRVLVSGCAHNGILNILDRYRDLFGGDPDVVISGFHMMKKQPYDCEELDVIDETARELARHNTVFYTGHCTGLPAFERMQTILGEQLRPLHSGVELDLATR